MTSTATTSYVGTVTLSQLKRWRRGPDTRGGFFCVYSYVLFPIQLEDGRRLWLRPWGCAPAYRFCGGIGPVMDSVSLFVDK